MDPLWVAEQRLPAGEGTMRVDSVAVGEATVFGDAVDVRYQLDGGVLFPHTQTLRGVETQGYSARRPTVTLMRRDGTAVQVLNTRADATARQDATMGGGDPLYAPGDPVVVPSSP